MRSLVILRGSPASGKSTWIKEMNLENYTLSADSIRLLVESPIIVPDKNHRVISQKNDNYVWQLLFELLEKRMARGEFVIIDATHSRSSDFSRYNKLCERYRYRRYYVDFSDVSLEECKRRNSLREDYKRVPEKVIDKMYSRLRTQGKTSGWVKVDRNNFWNEVGMKLFDLNQYERINIFGDIHGCYNPLKEYFETYPYNENNFYIFTGDYVDRGLQNKETLEFLMSLSDKKNVLFLEGNHERWINYYLLDEIENIKSHTFLKKTIPQILDLDKKDLRAFYRKIGQIAYFTYNGMTYLVCHGGISYVPNELQLIATDQFINGVGDYNVDIDEVFAKNMEEMIEKWEPIKGYEGYYEISTYGRIKSLAREIIHKDGKITHYKEKILSQSLGTKGYAKVILTKNGKGKCVFPHRIVAETFIPNPDNLPEVNHLDENKLNNHVSNLSWVTTKENCNYGTRIYRMAKNHKKGAIIDKTKPYEKVKPSTCFINVLDSDVIQVHAHRNVFEIDNFNNQSYNLEGKVEFGGHLRVLQLTKSNLPNMIKIKNDYFGTPEEVNEFKECKTNIEIPMIEQLRNSRDIKETVLDNNISSFNFTRNAFYKKNWNDLTCKARGLFVDTLANKVVARGYEKFFNVNERRETELEHLIVKFKDKITCYKKENGYLGIMSWVNGELFIASKSTNKGDFANWFRNIYEKSDINKQQLEYFLEKNDVSLTFEVIDIENDPHIIGYDKSKIVLLDIIHNDYEFKKEPYERVQELSNLINCECKTIYREFDDVREFHKWYLENTDEDDLTKEDIEGVVIECSGIMTKLKFPYYNFWKFMRRIKEQVANKRKVSLASLYNDISNYFYAWLKEQDEETLKEDIITLRQKFMNNYNR